MEVALGGKMLGGCTRGDIHDYGVGSIGFDVDSACVAIMYCEVSSKGKVQGRFTDWAHPRRRVHFFPTPVLRARPKRRIPCSPPLVNCLVSYLAGGTLNSICVGMLKRPIVFYEICIIYDNTLKKVHATP